MRSLESAALAALALGILGASMLVLPEADRSFDAPQHLALALSVTVAAGLLLWRGADLRAGITGGPVERIRLLCLAVAGFAVAGVVVSSRPETALEGLRKAIFHAALLPLGASRLLEGRGRKILLAVFLGVCGMQAVLSASQNLGWYQPLEIDRATGRGFGGALLGNEGHLALLLSFASLLLLGIAGTLSSPRQRWTAWSAAGLLGVVCISNPNVTALLALLAGAGVLWSLEIGRKAWKPLLAMGLIAAMGIALYGPFRYRVRETIGHARQGDWNNVLSNRLGPWGAAAEMALNRPLLGWGSGTYEAEYIPHRLQAELRLGQRLLIPTVQASFAEAHCEPLQAMAELGIPAALALLWAFGLLIRGLLKLARGAESPEVRTEVTLLLALMTAGFVACLTWFPLQRPITAFLLLLAAGRSWRLLVDASQNKAPRKIRSHLGSRALAIGLVVCFWPEFGHMRSEFQLKLAHSGFRILAETPRKDPNRPRRMEEIRKLALEAASGLVGDSRGYNLAGTMEIMANQPRAALEYYDRALAQGERPEIDLNIGRAYAILDERPQAFAAFVRTIWINPMLLHDLPRVAQPLVEGEVRRLEDLLKTGQLLGPPVRPRPGAETGRVSATGG